ncbi:hypothetical protein TNCV_3379121 [Trichonephila clavipes]|nr:hypothetical protein TNCV_3379121 [Trichonephila clavipes]
MAQNGYRIIVLFLENLRLEMLCDKAVVQQASRNMSTHVKEAHLGEVIETARKVTGNCCETSKRWFRAVEPPIARDPGLSRSGKLRKTARQWKEEGSKKMAIGENGLRGSRTQQYELQEI